MTCTTHFLLLSSPMIAIGLQAMLQRWPDGYSAGCSDTDPEQIMLQARTWQPDVSIVDADHLSIGALLETLGRERIKALGSLLILTAHPRESELFQAMYYGAMAYLSAYSEPGLLLSAIEAMRQGTRLFTSDILTDPVLLQRTQSARACRQVLEQQQALLAAHPEPVPNCLKEVERQMLLLVASGRGNKEIAVTLGLSLNWLRERFTDLYAKLKVRNRTEAVVLALRYGWIALDAVPSHKRRIEQEAAS
jgi:two-component system response regulator DegU